MRLVPRVAFVDPLHERKIFDMALRAHGDESAGDQIRPPPFGEGCAVQARSAGTLHSPAVEGQLLHGAATWTVVPTWKSNEWDELVGVLDALASFPVFRWKSEMGLVKTCLKAFFLHEPIGRTFFRSERPFVQPGGHERFIAAEVHKGTYAERTDEVCPSDRSEIWHACFAFLSWRVCPGPVQKVAASP